MSALIKSSINRFGDERLYPLQSGVTHLYRHNVAPTYNQPVIRQQGNHIGHDRNQAQDSSHSNPVISEGAQPSTDVEPSSAAKPGDIVIQSMRYQLYHSVFD
jgi:hypothetical protein